MGTNDDATRPTVFYDGAAAVSLWLLNEGFELAVVHATRSRWGRIQFTVEFDKQTEQSHQHAAWGHEYLDAHDHVVQDGDNWTVSEFVLLEELGLHPPRDPCRLAGCSRESDCWTVDSENGRARQYCTRHATLAAQSTATEIGEEHQYKTA